MRRAAARSRAGRALLVELALVFGGALLLTAFLWWGLVFTNVAANTSLSLQRAVPCLVPESDLCSLAMSLCGGRHWLGITRYSAELFWAGAAVSAAALAAKAFARGRA